ncbi:response regulator transcription factor [Nitrincola sp.]|uniref:response regulator transcription factor n=1 Tax=Nitrincola sp. TaxID=1926584 RepID=UPI003A8D08CA
MNRAIIHIVDDEAAVRRSLRWLLESVDLRVQEYAGAAEFLQAADWHQPGCALLDIRMPGMSGLVLQGELNRVAPTLPVIFMTGHGDVPMAVKAMKAGAFEFFEKPYNDQLLLDTVMRAIELHRLLLQQQAELRPVAELRQTLTPREVQVLDFLLQGTPSKRIAEQLSISSRTVDVHRHNIMVKMQVESLAELLHKCLSA